MRNYSDTEGLLRGLDWRAPITAHVVITLEQADGEIIGEYGVADAPIPGPHKIEQLADALRAVRHDIEEWAGEAQRWCLVQRDGMRAEWHGNAAALQHLIGDGLAHADAVTLEATNGWLIPYRQVVRFEPLGPADVPGGAG